MAPPPDTPNRARFVALSPAATLEVTASSSDGLTHEEAAARLRRDGPNRFPEALSDGLVRQFLGQFTHFFAVTLWAAAALSFLGGMPELGVAIILVIVVNGLFSFMQEYRAERATQALALLLPSRALVRRAGQRVTVPAEELVEGDVLLLEEGARISADVRLLRAVGLHVDNSTLTGESEPVERTAGTLPAPPADEIEAPNLAFAGSWVTSGSGVGVVIATGARTRLGGITQLTGRVVRRATPLHVSLNRAVRVIAVVALGAGLVFLLAALMTGMEPRHALLFTVGAIVALVPEGLLPTLTLSLAMGATRMARRGALVRHLEAVETLGATSVICTDKTGTLTANQMTVTELWVPGLPPLRVSGVGYAPGGALLREERPLGPAELAAVEPLLTVAALCGDARMEPVNGRWRCVGDPTDGALLVLAHKGGVERTAAERRAPRVHEFPFESARRRMSTVHVLPEAHWLLLAKGSPEAIVSRCTTVWKGTRSEPLTPAEAEALHAREEALAGRGLRVLALARRTLRTVEGLTPDSAERELEFLGLVGMFDPVRPEVPEAIARCRAAGIRVLIVTGDHPATACAVAKRMGLEGRVRLGSELPSEQRALERLLEEPITVLARVAPEQKLSIACALQGRGEVVAMTGDGVNDAPALRQADIGVAMGASGTDVAREAADLVLLDDNFSHIVEAVEEGRAAFANIRKFLTYHLTDNVAELMPFVLWALSGGRFPLVLSVLQILALDLGTDLLPALALGAERPEPASMHEPPRRPGTRLLGVRVLGRAFGFLGLVEAALSLALVPLGAALFLGWRPGEPLPHAGPGLTLLSTLVFASIVLMQVTNAFECRSTPGSLFTRGPLSNRLLVGAVCVELAALGAFIYARPVANVLGNRPLTWRELAVLPAAPLVFLCAEELRKAVARRHVRRKTRRRAEVHPGLPPMHVPSPSGRGLG